MDKEELRKQALRDIDAALSAPWIVQRFVKEETRKLLRASRSYWQSASDAELDRLLILYEKEY